jgi:hypothetical protein
MEPAARMAILRQAITRNMLREADGAALAMEGAAISKAPKSLGQLQGRIHGFVVQEGQTVRAKLTCDSPYGKYVEEGTGPAVGHGRYMPPKGALRLWVQRTLQPDAAAGDEENAIEAVETAVRWKIYMKGTKPNPFLRPAYLAERKKWKARVTRAVRAGIREAARA